MAPSKRPKSSRSAVRGAAPSTRRVPQARNVAPPAPGLFPVDLLLTQQQLAEAISVAIQNGRSMDAMVSGCLRVFLDRTGTTCAAVYFEDEQTKEMRVLATCGNRSVEEAVRQCEPMVARVMRENRALATAECLAAPLKRKRTVEGVVAVYGLPTDASKVEKIAGLLDFCVSHIEGGDPSFGVDATDLLPHFQAQLSVEVRKRLIQQQEVGLDDESPCESHTLLLSAGELVG